MTTGAGGGIFLTMRFSYTRERFFLNTGTTPVEPLHFLLKSGEIEGARWENTYRTWSLPPSVRCLDILKQSKLTPLNDDTAAYCDRLVAPVENYTVEQPEGFGIDLADHQLSGLSWLRWGATHKLLADEPGVGKTLQAIAWAWDKPNVVVVCPNPLIEQWIAEIANAGVKWAVHRKKTGNAPAIPVTKGEGRWLVVNYETLNKFGISKQWPYPEDFWLIADEVTYAKNTKSLRGKGLQALGVRAQRVLALTGTPIINRPLDTWAIYQLLRQRSKGEFWKWADRYTGAYRTPYGWDFSGATNLDELAADMKHFMVKRKLAEVEKFLPPLSTMTLEVALNNGTVKRLEAASARVMLAAATGASFEAGPGYATLQELRQESALAKVPFTAEWLTNHLDTGGGPVLVFSAFKEPLRRLSEQLGDKAIEYHGDLNMYTRERNKAAFLEGKAPVLLLSFSVGDMGLNLQKANNVILMDLPWTPAQMEQAVGRAYRKGQEHPVKVVRLTAGLPIEQRMLQALDMKRSIIEAINDFSEV